ncbi:hypothetical protein [uncultured Fusobacterium sp.]|uniref:hypothetical protein n=1 Tax=uncultured Fusobacterium sp. TaxID=159267 RepID=UPI002804E01B|nr:hypothetical protein [uncultured Fusobacterium sp.]
MKKIILLFFIALLTACSSTYIPNPGTITEGLTNNGKFIVKYDNLTTLENDKIVCKNGYELNGKFTGTITYKEKFFPEDLAVLRTKIIEQNFKSGVLDSVKVENHEDLDENGYFRIYNGTFNKDKKFTGTIETVLFYDSMPMIPPEKLVDFKRSEFHYEINYPYDYKLQGLVRKVYLNNGIELKNELTLKLYSNQIKDYNFDFVFYSEELKNGIKTIYANNMYKDTEEILVKYFALVDNYKTALKTYSKDKEFIEKKEKKFLNREKSWTNEDILNLMPISILKYNASGIKKEKKQEITLKYNVKTNKLIETKYSINDKIINTDKMSRKEKEDILLGIIVAEERNIRKKLTAILKERQDEIETDRRIKAFMNVLAIAAGQIQQYQQISNQQNQLEQAARKRQEDLFTSQMQINNLKLNSAPFSTNAEREAARVNMWNQSLNQYYNH